MLWVGKYGRSVVGRWGLKENEFGIIRSHTIAKTNTKSKYNNHLSSSINIRSANKLIGFVKLLKIYSGSSKMCIIRLYLIRSGSV